MSRGAWASYWASPYPKTDKKKIEMPFVHLLGPYLPFVSSVSGSSNWAHPRATRPNYWDHVISHSIGIRFWILSEYLSSSVNWLIYDMTFDFIGESSLLLSTFLSSSHTYTPTLNLFKRERERERKTFLSKYLVVVCSNVYELDFIEKCY